MSEYTTTNLSARRHQGLKTLARWGKITGIFYMVAGGLSALAGLIAFIVGAIPGLIGAWMGYLLFNAAKSAERIAYEGTGNENELDVLIESIGKYLMVNGVLIIVGIGMSVLSIGFMGSIVRNIFSF